MVEVASVEQHGLMVALQGLCHLKRFPMAWSEAVLKQEQRRERGIAGGVVLSPHVMENCGSMDTSELQSRA